MKLKKYYISILAMTVFSLVSISCTSGFEEANENPNSISTDVNLHAYNFFEPILYRTASNWLNYTWYWNDELIQFTAFTGGTTREEHRYHISDQDWKSVWNFYSGYATDDMQMIKLAKNEGDASLEAVGLTLKVLFMSNLTDMYGDIPYSQAFKVSEGVTKPVFDSQEEVYKEMFADLDSANTIYNTHPTFQKMSLDGMYNEDMTKWQKFNNSLYLRLICRISGRSEMEPAKLYANILDNPDKYPIFTSNDDNATVHFKDIDPYRSNFADYSESDFTSGGRKLTQQLIKMTVEYSPDSVEIYEDPRLSIWGKKATKYKNWKGTVSGCTSEEQSKVDIGTSWLNTEVFCRDEMPADYMDYAEVNFILSEAAYKGLIPGGEAKAKAYYEAGITASMQKWGALGQYSATPVTITQSDIDTYLTSSLALWDSDSNKEKLIADQKYLALFFVGMEAYHEYRRTGYPVLTIGAGTLNDHILPTRFAYPNVTVATNSANVNVALKRMGGDNNMKTPVWWSKQAIESNGN